MGKVVLVIVVLAAVWCGWWVAASSGLQRGIAKLIETRRAAGWQADVGEMKKQGFPTRLQTRLTDVSLTPPAQSAGRGIASAVAAKRIDISTPAYWPGYVTVASPYIELGLSGPNLRAMLSAEDVTTDLRLRPSVSGQLDRLTLDGGAWVLDLPVTGPVEGHGLNVSAVQQTVGQPIYDLALDAQNVTPSAALRGLFGLPDDWAEAFDTVTAKATITFDRLWDRKALGRTRPQPRVIDLRHAELAWGDIALSLNGTIAVAEDGLATGTLSVAAQDWPTMLIMAESAGYIPPNFRPQAEQMLKGLAQMSGNTDALDLDITVKDGKMSVGFIPLGRAPKIILR
ncbi:DUF2125 domain-containing protein [Sulfitobacter sp. M39]|nr:DUF2125 domain-containing protein [Sulfitobacter sp. M39]MCF7748657.1 DUF2125 domain-containing protein [Sulfitobacter sp. M39]